MARRRVLGLALLAALGGCLSRSLPVPPPVVQSIQVEPCDAATCPNGGVTVIVEGDQAVAGAQVIVEDTNPATRGLRGEVLAGVARATALGAWRVVLVPQRDPGGGVRAPQRGDTLMIYQVTPSFETSQSRFREVPRM